MHLHAQILFVFVLCECFYGTKEILFKSPFYKLHGSVIHGRAVSESWRQHGVVPPAAAHRDAVMSCEVNGRRVTADEKCVLSPIWSPKLTRASSTPGHSSHTSCLQSPFQDPRLKLVTTAGKRAVPPGPDHLVTLHKQPSAGFAPLTHTCVWVRPAAPPGVRWRVCSGSGAASRASQRPAVSIPQQNPPGPWSSTSTAPQVTSRHYKRQSWRWHQSRAPGKVTPAWRLHSQPTVSENTNWKARATRKQLTRADVCIWRAASLHFHSSCTWFRSKLENDN